MKPHDHLNDLPPDAWANKARLLPEYEYIIEEKKDSPSNNSLRKVPSEVLLDRILKIQEKKNRRN